MKRHSVSLDEIRVLFRRLPFLDHHRMRSLQIISCLALVAIATLTASNCRAQQVGSLDHTKTTAYSRELRRPAASTTGTRWLGAVFADVFSVLKVSDCALGNSGLARETFGKKLLRFLAGFDPGISDRPLFRIREKSHPPGLGLPLQLNIDRSSPPAQRVDASLPME